MTGQEAKIEKMDNLTSPRPFQGIPMAQVQGPATDNHRRGQDPSEKEKSNTARKSLKLVSKKKAPRRSREPMNSLKGMTVQNKRRH